ncbi:MAG: hypothetical protein LBB86_06980 [Oscillospiraceae bacterium]|jgi:hypothetical protein|nr:hypothetical protein [Oscillospiraceae bacterium]
MSLYLDGNDWSKYDISDVYDDYEQGADIVFVYKDVEYGLFFFLTPLEDGGYDRKIYVGPSGKHETKGYPDVEALLADYRMHDGATLAEALPEADVDYHS